MQKKQNDCQKIASSKHIPYLKRKQKECKSIHGLQTTQVSNYTVLAKFMNQQHHFLKNWSLLVRKRISL